MRLPSQEPLTFDKVWQMFQETDKKFQETDKKIHETSKQIKETDRVLTEQIKETDRVLTEKFKETDRVLTEQFKETDKQIKVLGVNIGGLSNNIGESVEEFFYHGFARNPVIGKLRFKNVVQYMKTDKVEYDIALTNGKYIAIIEVKHKFHPNDIGIFIEKRLSLLRKEFAKFEHCKVIACIAGFVIPKTTKEKANSAGLYIFTQSGENIKILNDKNFKPKEY